MNIEERLERIERTNRRLELAVTCLVLGLTAAVFTAMGEGNRPRSLAVFDSQGNKRAALAVGAGGEENPALVFFGANGREGLFVGIGKDGPLVRFSDASGAPGYFINCSGPRRETLTAEGDGRTIVCFNRKKNDKVFHRCPRKGEPRCKDFGEGFPSMITLREALEKGMKPCPKCLPEFSR